MRTLSIMQIVSAIALAGAMIAAVLFTDSNTLATSFGITAALLVGTASDKRECCCLGRLFRRRKSDAPVT